MYNLFTGGLCPGAVVQGGEGAFVPGAIGRIPYELLSEINYPVKIKLKDVLLLHFFIIVFVNLNDTYG